MHTPRHALPVLAAALLVLAGLAGAAEPTPQDRHAAQCVAALEASADDLVRQVKAGTESARKPLLDRLTQGAAFVGNTYLHGDANEDQARALIDQAEIAQRTLPPAELAARQAACGAEATRLLAKANALERAVVKRVARKRMDKLLGS
ncbi:MAG: hypothetical protein QE285_18865 [Aquabacterium sp.]|nr:hypothetical protein [Aquabacterium sp.]